MRMGRRWGWADVVDGPTLGVGRRSGRADVGGWPTFREGRRWGWVRYGMSSSLDDIRPPWGRSMLVFNLFLFAATLGNWQKYQMDVKDVKISSKKSGSIYISRGTCPLTVVADRDEASLVSNILRKTGQASLAADGGTITHGSFWAWRLVRVRWRGAGALAGVRVRWRGCAGEKQRNRSAASY